jgi:hypothetical protein
MKYARPFARLPPGTSGARRRVSVERRTVGMGVRHCSRSILHRQGSRFPV